MKHTERISFFIPMVCLVCTPLWLETIILKSPVIGSGNFTSSATQKLSKYNFLYVHLCLETTYLCHSQVWTLYNIVCGKTLLKLTIHKINKKTFKEFKKVTYTAGFFWEGN